MFNRVLLPLDGSDLAEAVFPYAEELARKLGSEIVLFHVCESSHKLALNMHRLYLEKSAELLRQRLDLCDKGKKAKVRTEFVAYCCPLTALKTVRRQYPTPKRWPGVCRQRSASTAWFARPTTRLPRTIWWAMWAWVMTS